MIDNKRDRDEYVKYRLQKANKTIKEIEILIEGKLWNTAINRMYYACYYAVGALLIKNGIETTTHSGARQKFGQLFIQAGLIDKNFGKHYSLLFEGRQTGDYTDFYDIDEETVLSMYQPSIDFIKEIEKHIQK